MQHVACGTHSAESTHRAQNTARSAHHLAHITRWCSTARDSTRQHEARIAQHAPHSTRRATTFCKLQKLPDYGQIQIGKMSAWFPHVLNLARALLMLKRVDKYYFEAQLRIIN
jgi:hypothetical protein